MHQKNSYQKKASNFLFFTKALFLFIKADKQMAMNVQNSRDKVS